MCCLQGANGSMPGPSSMPIDFQPSTSAPGTYQQACTSLIISHFIASLATPAGCQCSLRCP